MENYVKIVSGLAAALVGGIAIGYAGNEIGNESPSIRALEEIACRPRVERSIDDFPELRERELVEAPESIRGFELERSKIKLAGFQETYRTSEGQYIGELGSMTYLFDDELRFIAAGHSITQTEDGQICTVKGDNLSLGYNIPESIPLDSSNLIFMIEQGTLELSEGYLRAHFEQN